MSDNAICKMNRYKVPTNKNVTVNLVKRIQKVPTQEKLDSAHLLRCDNRRSDDVADRDINLYDQLGDFLDILKPRHRVVVKFLDAPEPVVVQHEKSTKQLPPWMKTWMTDWPDSEIEYCTDVHGLLRIMGPMCSLIN